MKKTLLPLILMIFSLITEAQSVVTYYQLSDNYIELRDLMETRDGNVIMNCPVFDPSSMADLGTWLYKVSQQGDLLDSLFIEDNDMRTFLLAPNPIDESNYIFASIYRDLDNISSSLKIRFFTDNPIEFHDEISVPLQDTIVRIDAFYIDPDDDIIAAYYASGHHYLTRVGIDGTLKDKAMLPKLSMNLYQYKHVGLFTESPREYCFWGSDTHDNHAIYNVVVDSLLNFVRETKLNSTYSGGASEQILYFNDSTYILSSKYTDFHPYVKGLHLSKFNKSHECLKTVIFTENRGSIPFPIWTAKSADGGIYYSYDTDAYGKQIAVVKLDDDLNVCWKRYCLKEGPFHWGVDMVALGNGGVAVGGFDSKSGPEHFRAFLLILQADASTTETEGLLKPYLAYPNPAANTLHLEISPDVTVGSVSLYDVSGRLAKTQTTGFEAVDISGFAPGVYLMKVTLENGKVFEEKIVKQ